MTLRLAALAALLILASPSAHAFDLQGHRGARGLAPENTLPAFETALKIGVSTLELDLAVTKDGILTTFASIPIIRARPTATFCASRAPPSAR